MRYALAVLLGAVVAGAVVLATRVPIEGGGILFGPLLLGVGYVALHGIGWLLRRRG